MLTCEVADVPWECMLLLSSWYLLQAQPGNSDNFSMPVFAPELSPCPSVERIFWPAHCPHDALAVPSGGARNDLATSRCAT
jgi:hypothetical protein